MKSKKPIAFGTFLTTLGVALGFLALPKIAQAEQDIEKDGLTECPYFCKYYPCCEPEENELGV